MECPVWVRFELNTADRADAERKVCEALKDVNVGIPFRVVLAYQRFILDRSGTPVTCVDDALYERLSRN